MDLPLKIAVDARAILDHLFFGFRLGADNAALFPHSAVVKSL
jgi:hypothetical protein